MKASERDEQVKKLQEQAETLRAKIYDLQNAKVEPDPISFVNCADEIQTIQSYLQHQALNYDISFEVREEKEYKNLGIYLGHGPCEWEIVKDSDDAWVLIPKVNKIVKVKTPAKKRTSKISSVAGTSDFEAEEGDA